MEKIKLNNDWEFKLANTNFVGHKLNIEQEKWYKAKVPGTIHTDLLDNKIIEDPFYSDNETKANWIANCDWIYSKEFTFDKIEDEDYQIIFDGLDTIADIYLNDNIIGKANNMFVQYKYDVSNFLNNGKNVLKVKFESPNKYSEEEESKYSKLPVALKSSRVYIRKAQYSFGWDWGPVLTTSGIWKDVYLIKKAKAEIENITFKTLSISENSAEIEISINVENRTNDELLSTVKLSQ